MRNSLLSLSLSFCCLVSFAACGMDDEASETPQDTVDGGAGDAEVPVFNVSGAVFRTETASVAPEGDGSGTVYIAALAECRLGAPVRGASVITDADLSSLDGRAAFTIPDLPPATYFLITFLDDIADADPQAPLPGPGDLVHAPSGVGDGSLDCVAAEVRDAEVVGITISLDGTVPGPF